LFILIVSCIEIAQFSPYMYFFAFSMYNPPSYLLAGFSN